MLNTANTEPTVRVGILLSDKPVTVIFHGDFKHDGLTVTGEHTFDTAAGYFTPTSPDCRFEVKDVVIGVNFHWERTENQCFDGELQLMELDGKLQVVNIVSVENYLRSVISSEMSATASLQLLKAHAVISRSWLLAQIDHKQREKIAMPAPTDSELVKWYDHEDHTLFDVCADDHCQRYQGTTRQTTDKVREAVDTTRGQVLTDPADGSLCDARFSKCCGGVFEEFEACWEPIHYSYLVPRRDSVNPLDFPNLRPEAAASEWINSRPEAFCNTSDPEILSQVLNNYDQETTDFYRWDVTYDQATLAELIKRRSGIDFGHIKALVPVERGTSGRLIRLRIEGTKRTLTIGKELEIRRTLSESHLYSSAFTVETGEELTPHGVPATFTLHGAGWGHGVGLCQIGAAVMGAKGYSYTEILSHYYPGANLSTIY